MAWEGDPKIDGLGEVKEVPKSLSVVECVYTGVYTVVNVCKVEWSCWKDLKKKKGAKSCINSV